MNGNFLIETRNFYISPGMTHHNFGFLRKTRLELSEYEIFTIKRTVFKSRTDLANGICSKNILLWLILRSIFQNILGRDHLHVPNVTIGRVGY